MANTDPQSALIAEVTATLAPLATAAASTASWQAFSSGLGWNLAAVDGLDQTALATAVTAVGPAITALSAVASTGLASLSQVIAALGNAQGAFTSIRALTSLHLDAALPPDLLTTFVTDVIDFLVDQHLSAAHPAAYRALILFGVLIPASAAPAGTPIVSPVTQAVIRAAQPRPSSNSAALSGLLHDPVGWLRTRFDPGGSDAEARITALAGVLLGPLTDWLSAVGLDGAFGGASDLLPQFSAEDQLDASRTVFLQQALTADDESVETFNPISAGAIVSLGATLGTESGQPALVLTPSADVSFSVPKGGWAASLDAAAVVNDLIVTATGVSLPQPDGTASPAADATVTVTISRVSAEPLQFGSQAGSQLTLSSPAFTGTLVLTPSSFEVQVAGDSGAAAFTLNTGDGGGLLQVLLGALCPPQTPVTFRAGVMWSSKTGLHVQAANGLAGPGGIGATIPLHASFGPLSTSTLTMAVAPAASGAGLTASIDGALALGPVTLTFDRLGISAVVSVPDGGGNLGPLDLQLGFAPPTGAGLSVDAPVVSGGGFFAADPTGTQFLGAVALSVGTVSVQGVGVLSTKMPGGGWSLIALADVDGLAIQLGFGIEITGMGVLAGVNRTMNVAALQTLARSGGLSSVMFPADLAANAPRVAADLGSLFPAAQGQYVLGPTVQLTWGPDALITGELAVYIELPSPLRVAVLGALQITLPDPDDAVVSLHLDLLGIIDLTAKTLALDMSLSHSALAGMPLTGQAALRAGWGGQPAFLFAAGGWNPYFTPPAGFPKLARIGLFMGGGSLQLRLTSYLAVTTNTLQLGAAIDLYAAAGPAAFTATASFDALVQFKPFALELDLAICAAITLNGTPVLSLSISAHLTGPDPWHISGQAQFSIMFFSFTIPISGTFGNAIPQAVPAVVDIFGPLAAAVADPGSWILPTPPGPPAVLLRNGYSGSAVHPLGSLTLHQRVVPLEQQIDRFGADVLAAATTVSLSACGATTAADGVTDLFAPAQFVTMTDAQKLSAPSFQALTSGFTIGTAGLVVPVTGGTSAASPQQPPVATSSSPAWDALVIDCTITPAAAGVTGAGPVTGAGLAASGLPVASGPLVTSTPAGVTVPDSVLAAQLPGAAAAVCGTAASGAGAFPGPRYGIAPQAPDFAVASLGLANENPAGAWFGSQAAAASAAGTAQQTVYLSELSQTPALS